MASTANARRLFLALWPGEAECERLAELVRTVDGAHSIKPANLHLTLVFLGATSAERLTCYEGALSDFTMPPLTLTLDRFGFWPKPRILWLGPSHAPTDLLALVRELNRRLERCGFTPESRPFFPHITLARKFSGPVPRDQLSDPLSWPVDCLVLAESVRRTSSTDYQVLHSWPIGSGTRSEIGFVK